MTGKKLSTNIIITISYKNKILEEYDKDKNWIIVKTGINLKLRPNLKQIA